MQEESVSETDTPTHTINDDFSPSLLYTLHKTFGMKFYMAGVIKFIYDITQLISPYFVKLIIDYVAKPDSPVWLGLTFAFSLFLLNVVGTLLVNQYFHIVCNRCMIHSRTYVVMALDLTHYYYWSLYDIGHVSGYENQNCP